MTYYLPVVLVCAFSSKCVGVGMSVRAVLGLLAIIAMATAGFAPAPAYAQSLALAPVPGPQSITDAINSFPSGGEPLKQRISDLIKQNPELASTVANTIQANNGLSEAVKTALEQGLADALNALGVSGFVGIPLGALAVGAGVAGGGAAAGILSTQKKASPN